MSNKKNKRRSAGWFARNDKEGFFARSWLRNQGTPGHLFDGRPVIGICNTWSELTPCNGHLRDLAQNVRNGVYEAGGYPLEFPVMSLGETLMRPTSMLYRNLVSMDVEESIRANPLDGLVLLVGCDKTTPALLMGAASCDLPTIVVSGGPMLNGRYKGRTIGSGTSIYEFSEGVRAGTMSVDSFVDAEAATSRSAGSCMTMGTASTMAAMCEALGVSLPGNAAIPAVDARRKTLAHVSGSRIVEMVEEDLNIAALLSKEAFENAIIVNGAIGGSSNAVVHLIALAGRLGVDLTLDDWDTLGRGVPCLVDLMPSGRFLMEDLYYAGGLPAVIREIGHLVRKDAGTVNGKTLWDNCKSAECFNREVIRTFDQPLSDQGGIMVLRGNLAERGAVIKPSAATPELLQHSGRAVVFEDIDDYKARIDDPDLDVEAEDILIMKNCGPKGYPGFAEVGNMGLPKKLLAQGVKDMVRISDARMSGTAYGTVVLHVAPEAASGGTLALVESGDQVVLDAKARRLELQVDAAELAERRKRWTPPPPHTDRGYQKLYYEHVLQADEGVDFDFLRGGERAGVPRDAQ